MNRRDFAHLLAISGAAPFGWGEKELNSALSSAAAHSPDSTTSLPVPSLKPGRRIEGASAVLLPFTVRDEIDWSSFGSLLDRTWAAGLTPAVNMDTGYVNLLTAEERVRVLAYTGERSLGRKFIAGAFIEGDGRDPAVAYLDQVDTIRAHGGTPILAKYLVASPEATSIAADLINRYPDRFLFGTDEVAPADQQTYLKVYYQYGPLWKLRNADASEKVRQGNYERPFDRARQSVRAWEQTHTK